MQKSLKYGILLKNGFIAKKIWKIDICTTILDRSGIPSPRLGHFPRGYDWSSACQCMESILEEWTDLGGDGPQEPKMVL